MALMMVLSMGKASCLRHLSKCSATTLVTQKLQIECLFFYIKMVIYYVQVGFIPGI